MSMPFSLPEFCGVVSICIWIYLLLARGSFWRVRDKLPAESREIPAARVAVVIPARNEGDVIAESVTSLLTQSYGGSIRLFLVDDGSVDHTVARATEAAKRIGQNERLIVIPGRPLPAGWSGKLWAVQQGIERAQDCNPEFFLLTDADIAHAPDNIATLVNLAGARCYDLVSLMAKLRCETVAEKLLIPAFVFFFFKLYPPKWIAETRRTTAGAAGGCILIRPEMLARSGGIAAIRNEIIDDCALAHRVKQSGGKVWLGLTRTTFSLRPYQSFSAVGRMISRTAFNQLHHSAFFLIGALLGMAFTYVLPILLVFSRERAAEALGAAAWSLMTIAYLPMVEFYDLGMLSAVALPVAAIFYAGATIHSAMKFWLGLGGEWKGRVQDPMPN